MNTDKYIDEIADILQETDDKIRKTTMHDCATYGDFAEAIINAGYSKADEVRKETYCALIKIINNLEKEELEKLQSAENNHEIESTRVYKNTMFICGYIRTMIRLIAKKQDIEVDG